MSSTVLGSEPVPFCHGLLTQARRGQGNARSLVSADITKRIVLLVIAGTWPLPYGRGSDRDLAIGLVTGIADSKPERQ
jgi:hypothetical protein